MAVMEGVSSLENQKSYNTYVGELDEEMYKYGCTPLSVIVYSTDKNYAGLTQSNCHGLFCPVHGATERANIAKNTREYAVTHSMYQFLTLTSGADISTPELALSAYNALAVWLEKIINNAKKLRFEYYLAAKRFDGTGRKTKDQYHAGWLVWLDGLVRYEYMIGVKRAARYWIGQKGTIDERESGYALLDQLLTNIMAESARSAITMKDMTARMVSAVRSNFAYFDGYKAIDEVYDNVYAYLDDYLGRVAAFDEVSNVVRGFTNDLDVWNYHNVHEHLGNLEFIGTWEVGEEGHLHLHIVTNYPMLAALIEPYMTDEMRIYKVLSVNRDNVEDVSNYLTKLSEYVAKGDTDSVRRIRDIGVFGKQMVEGKVVRGKSLYITSYKNLKLRTIHKSVGDRDTKFKFGGFAKSSDYYNKIAGVRHIDIETEIPTAWAMIQAGDDEKAIKEEINFHSKVIIANRTLGLAQNADAIRIWSEVVAEYPDTFVDAVDMRISRGVQWSVLWEIRYSEFITRYMQFRAKNAGVMRPWYQTPSLKIAGVDFAACAMDKMIANGMSKEQSAIVRDMFAYPEVVVQAPAGSGKTYLVSSFLNHTPFAAEKIAVLAFTGTAAQEIQSRVTDPRYRDRIITIDSFLGLRKSSRSAYYHSAHNQTAVEVVFIDEFERLSPEKRALLLMSLPLNVKIINTGDMNQVAAHGHRFSGLDTVKGANVGVFTLTRNHRVQVDFEDRGLLTVKTFEDRKSEIVDFVLAGGQVLTNMHKLRKMVNAWVLDAIESERSDDRVRADNGIYVTGDRVVIKRNRSHHEDDRFNSRNGETGTVRVFPDGRVYYPPFIDEQYKDVMMSIELDNGRGIRLFDRAELCREVNTIQHAYAITIQSSQGREYDNVMVLVGKTRRKDRTPAYASKEVVYTGTSRARRSVLVMTDIPLKEYIKYSAQSFSYDYLHISQSLTDLVSYRNGGEELRDRVVAYRVMRMLASDLRGDVA